MRRLLVCVLIVMLLVAMTEGGKKKRRQNKKKNKCAEEAEAEPGGSPKGSGEDADSGEVETQTSGEQEEQETQPEDEDEDEDEDEIEEEDSEKTETEVTPRWQCYHWSAEDNAAINRLASTYGMSRLAAERHVCSAGRSTTFKFTRGNNDRFPGCGTCWCCQRVSRWKCYHWTPEDRTKIASLRKAGKTSVEAETQTCTEDRSTTFQFTQGRNDKHPGCGTCWCCEKVAPKLKPWWCLNLPETAVQRVKNARQLDRKEAEKLVCQQYRSENFRYTDGQNTDYDGCRECSCCGRTERVWTPWQCHIWTPEEKVRVQKMDQRIPLPKRLEKVCTENREATFQFTRGRNENNRGCGRCGCCMKRPEW